MKLTNEITKEMNCVEKLFQEELAKWENRQVKLLILGEAPLSCKKYFYGKNRGTYLSGLRKHLKSELPDLLDNLREKGIFAIDIYQYPIATSLYDKDKENKLFDSVYLDNKIKDLNVKGLLTQDTKAVFRYKKLISRRLLPVGSFLDKILIRDSSGTPISLFKQERPNQLLTENMKVLINSF